MKKSAKKPPARKAAKPAAKKTTKPAAKSRPAPAAKPKPAASSRPAVKPGAAAYTPQPIEGIGWAPFRYPLS